MRYLQQYQYTLYGVYILWNSTCFVHSKCYYKFKNKFRFFSYYGHIGSPHSKITRTTFSPEWKKTLEITLGSGFQAQLSHSEKSIPYFSLQKGLGDPSCPPLISFSFKCNEATWSYFAQNLFILQSFLCTAVAGRTEATVRSKQIGTNN